MTVMYRYIDYSQRKKHTERCTISSTDRAFQRGIASEQHMYCRDVIRHHPSACAFEKHSSQKWHSTFRALGCSISCAVTSAINNAFLYASSMAVPALIVSCNRTAILYTVRVAIPSPIVSTNGSAINNTVRVVKIVYRFLIVRRLRACCSVASLCCCGGTLSSCGPSRRRRKRSIRLCIEPSLDHHN